MDLSAFLKTIAAWPIWQSIEDWPVGQGVAESTYLFPLVESIHVVSLGFVVGSIFFLDLRLMGMAGKRMSVRQASRILPYTWGAFVLAAISGALMFAPAAHRYIENWAFTVKFVLIFLAGANMFAFHFGIWRKINEWDESAAPPMAARIAGLLSALFWVGAVMYGRLVPFVA